MKIVVGVTTDRKIFIETREDDGKALAHILLDPEIARTHADAVNKAADIAEGVPQMTLHLREGN